MLALRANRKKDGMTKGQLQPRIFWWSMCDTRYFKKPTRQDYEHENIQINHEIKFTLLCYKTLVTKCLLVCVIMPLHNSCSITLMHRYFFIPWSKTIQYHLSLCVAIFFASLILPIATFCTDFPCNFLKKQKTKNMTHVCCPWYS